MRTARLNRLHDSCERLRAKLQQPPGTPASRVILKPGMKAQTYNPTIRKLESLEATIKAITIRGLS